MLHHRLLPFVLTLSVSMPFGAAQDAAEGYQLPPAEVVEIVDARPNPSMRFSPDFKWSLSTQGEALPSLEIISRPMLRLAGMRIDPGADASYRTRFQSRLSLAMPGRSDARQEISLPAGVRLSSVTWSHDSTHFAYVLESRSGSRLYGASAVDVIGGAQPKLLTERLSTVTGGVTWMPDGKTLLCRLVPKVRGSEPMPPTTPSGPNISEAVGDKSPLRTYQDLLSSPHDELLFEHYATTQLTLIPVDAGKPQKIGKPGIFATAQPSADGERLLVGEVHGPYSYFMPWSSFPKRISVWDLSGESLFVLADLPLAENIPLGGVSLGPRSVRWQPHTNAGLLWVEALDGGDPKREVTHRDRVMTLAAPYAGTPQELLRTEHRSSGLSFTQDPQLFIATEYDRDRRWVRALLHDLSKPQAKPRVIEDRNTRDGYGHPGRLLSQVDSHGQSLVRIDQGHVYRTGSGASPQGLLPFLDRQSLADLTSTRLWRCEPGSYESVSQLLAPKSGGQLAFITSHESPDSPPNYRQREVGAKAFVALTDYPHPTPQLKGISKQLVTYERADGVPLSATLYLPADYKPGQRLPLMVWAYPREFNDPKTAGQVSSTPWRFNRIAGLSHLMLLTQGYAIMDGATMPVVGDPETMNDSFVEQIVAAAQAAIDKAVGLGVADRERVVVGGHSYGAFMTANLLAHCD
ncbi:MAG: dipeptidyl aminopeptidase/acylaminoacyl peptidase, partial [Planctomycetota bacterium]